MLKQLLCASLLSLSVGCQLSTAALTKHFGGGDDPPAPAPVAASEPVPEPAYHSTYAGGPATEPESDPEPNPEAYGVMNDRAPPADLGDQVSRIRNEQPPRPERVDLRAGERAPAGAETTCRVQGRSAMCGGVCTDVQVDDNHCGQCNDPCDSGSHCDYGTCRDAAGNPT